MQPAYAENQRKSEKKTLATCGMANSFTFAHFLFISSLLFTFYFIRFCFIFFGTIICQLRPRPWRKVFILINESRWSAESWFAFAFAVLLLAFHSISESYQFEFLLSLTRHSI